MSFRRLPACLLRHGRALLFALTLAAVVTFGGKAAADGTEYAAANPAFAVDLNGRPVDPLRQAGTNLVVLFFVSVDCPISNRYAPEVRRLWDQFSSRGVTFWLVYADPTTTARAIRKHRTEFRYPFEALHDPQHTLVRRGKATTTPECAVFNRNGQLAYHGRIDNFYADFGKARPRATERELRDALETLLDGRKPAREFVPAVGCRIPDPP